MVSFIILVYGGKRDTLYHSLKSFLMKIIIIIMIILFVMPLHYLKIIKLFTKASSSILLL